MDIIKAHAYGNDFLFVPEDQAGGRDRAALARAACARHTGVGADGLIFYRRTPSGATMKLFNADGSAAEISGNAVRCLAAIVWRDTAIESSRPASVDRTHQSGPQMVIETDAGKATLTLLEATDNHYTLRAMMGPASRHPASRYRHRRRACARSGVIGGQSPLCDPWTFGG